MRITHVNKYYWPPHLGGIETHLHDIASGEAARDGLEVRAIVANESRETVRETVDGVDVTRLGRVTALSNTPIAPSMARAIRAEATRPDPADVLHLHFPYPWGEVSWRRAHAGLPTVLMYHSDIVRQKKALALYRPVLERFLDEVDLIIASSPNMVEHSPFLSPRAEKCRVVPFGIHVERFAETPGLLTRATGLRAPHKRPIVLFVGRLIYYKGADVLVRAMAHVDADLVMIGRGPLESELRELAVAHGVADRITWVPPVGDDELAAWYHAADVFALAQRRALRGVRTRAARGPCLGHAGRHDDAHHGRPVRERGRRHGVQRAGGRRARPRGGAAATRRRSRAAKAARRAGARARAARLHDRPHGRRHAEGLRRGDRDARESRHHQRRNEQAGAAGVGDAR